MKNAINMLVKLTAFMFCFLVVLPTVWQFIFNALWSFLGAFAPVILLGIIPGVLLGVLFNAWRNQY